MSEHPENQGPNEPAADDAARLQRRAFLRQAGAVSLLAAGSAWAALAPAHWPGSL